MKKLLAVSLVSVSLCATLAQAKFFIGVEGGYDTGFPGFGDIKNKRWHFGTNAFDGYSSIRYHGWTAGINLGTEHNLGDSFALRWLFGANYGEYFAGFTLLGNGFQSFTFDLAIDGIYNFIKTNSTSFGVFVGLGTRLDQFGIYLFEATDFATQEHNTGTSLAFLGRVGLTFGLGEHHRFDATAAIPFTSMTMRDYGPVYNSLRVTLGYKYLF